jgi:hypothetical protein
MARVVWISGDKYDFTRQNVDKSPDQEGVYGLVRAGEKIYVGGGNIRAGLRSHFRGEDSCIKRKKSTHYYREPMKDWTTREKELIEAFDPVCNRKVG